MLSANEVKANSLQGGGGGGGRGRKRKTKFASYINIGRVSQLQSRTIRCDEIRDFVNL